MPKKALGAQGSSGCSRKHWVLKEALGAALGKEESIECFCKKCNGQKSKIACRPSMHGMFGLPMDLQ